GYFSLFPNLATLFASRSVPLEYAPCVTTYLAFFIQIIPFAIICWGNSPFWSSRLHKTGLTCIVLFAPCSGEIWLNTINSQFYFSLIAFFILMEAVSASRMRLYAYSLLLCLCGLTGPVSCFLTPLFLFKAFKNNNKESWIHAGIFFICSVVQGSIILTSGAFWLEKRFFFDLPVISAAFWNKTVFLALLGPDAAPLFSKWLVEIRMSHFIFFQMIGVALLIIGGWLGYLIFLKIKKEPFIYLFGSFILLMSLSFMFSQENKICLLEAFRGQRYCYVPNVILLSMLLGLVPVGTFSKRFFINVPLVLLAFAMILGIMNYRGSLIVNANWPLWTDEIRKWRMDSSYCPEIWPYGWKPDGWRVCLDASCEIKRLSR
ncbi:MAG: hypothetical protein JW774_13260, partial [Candidatus Aureabacteria bacterium]|nr:hypothetical protein [Candidatus Auribacterota bacterium]